MHYNSAHVVWRDEAKPHELAALPTRRRSKPRAFVRRLPRHRARSLLWRLFSPLPTLARGVCNIHDTKSFFIKKTCKTHAKIIHKSYKIIRKSYTNHAKLIQNSYKHHTQLIHKPYTTRTAHAEQTCK